MDLKQTFIKFLMIALGLTAKEAEAKVPDGTEDFAPILEDLTKAHKLKVEAQKTEDFDQGHQKATLEILNKRDEEIKEKYGIKSKKKGAELLDEVIAAKVPDPKNPDSIPADVVKKHPAYLERERELSTQVKEAKDETATKVKEVQDSYAQKESFTKVGNTFLDRFRGMNPVLPEDKEKAARQEARLLKELEASDLVFQLQDGQDPLILERAEDGTTKRKEDGHGNPIKFDDFVRNTADNFGFEFRAGEPRSTPGGNQNTNTPPVTPGARKYVGKLPETEKEYVAIATNSSIPLEQRGEVQDYWEQKNSPKP